MERARFRKIINDLIGVDIFRFRLIGAPQAVSEDIVADLFDIVRGDIALPFKKACALPAIFKARLALGEAPYIRSLNIARFIGWQRRV